MRIRPLLPKTRVWRAPLVLALALFALASLGARCIERTSIHVDADGYTHVTGEMDNDTDIQATRVMLRATLFDAQDNVIATKDSLTCPPDTQPHSQITFDIKFDNPGIPTPARFEVRPVSGTVLSANLPDPDVVVITTDAIRFTGLPNIPGIPITDKDVLFRFSVRNRSTRIYDGVQGCAAVYNNQGQVIASYSSELIEFDQNDVPHPASLDNAFPVDIFWAARDVPIGPVQVRAWLWFASKGAPTSPVQFIATPMITIQTRSFP